MAQDPDTVSARAAREPTAGSSRARLPPLILVRAFEAVGRTGSMRKAADDIGVSHTVVSRHVRNLEAWLGTKLLLRGPRGATLTADGRDFLASVTTAFDLIARSALELRPHIRSGILRVWCAPGLAARWLTPRLSELETVLPGTDIVIRATQEMPDFSSFEADLAICFGEESEMPAGAVPLLQPRMFPVASPIFLERGRRPATLAELALCPLIHEESREQWRLWLEKSGVTLSGPLTGPRLSNAGLCLDAALSGQGIALAMGLNAGEEIAAGRLVELFATDTRLGRYFLVAPRERWSDPLLARFRAWISASIERTEAFGAQTG